MCVFFLFRKFWFLGGTLPCATLEELNNYLCDTFVAFDQLGSSLQTPGEEGEIQSQTGDKPLKPLLCCLHIDSLNDFSLATPASLARWLQLRDQQASSLFLLSEPERRNSQQRRPSVSPISCQLINVSEASTRTSSTPLYKPGSTTYFIVSLKSLCTNYESHTL